MSMRALSFGAIAEAYERFRPAYPEAVYEAVAAYAGGPISTALEIGSGTGKATRLFAAHGIDITATEPDGGMLAELRKSAPPNVTPVQSTFEDLDTNETYDLVYVASALHWTQAEGRWDRMATFLEPGGVFASFACPIQFADPDVEAAVRAARAPYLDRDDIPAPDGTPPEAAMRWPGTELQKSDHFTDVQQFVVDHRFSLTAEDYIGYLSTVSAYLQLPAPTRQRAYEAIARVLPDTVEINADITPHLARRA